MVLINSYCSVRLLCSGVTRSVSNILIHLLDDDDAVRTSLARLLILSGCDVKEYASGTELLDAADELKRGIILLDVNMPETDGYAVLRALRARSIGLPVVMMTGAGAAPINADVAGFIKKPFLRADLMAVLDKVSAGSQTRTKAS